MARVTVEDCVVNIPNRFELVLLALHRARNIAAGEPLTLERDNDKNAVVALREIAEQSIDLDQLSERLIQGLQRHVEVDEPEEDGMSLSIPAAEWAEGESEQGEARAAEEARKKAAEDAEQLSESDSKPKSEGA